MSLRTLLLVLLTTTACGCAGLGGPSRLAQLSLPDPAQLRCCWQSQEQVRITRADNLLDVVAAVALTPDRLTVVVFDALGRSLVTLVHEDGEVQTRAAPAEWSAALSHQLLLAIYLHHLPVEQWRFEQPGWSAVQEANVKSLQCRQRDLVRLRYDHGSASEHPLRHIEFVGRNIQLDVQTLARTEL